MRMKVKDLLVLVNEEISLRKANPNKISEYAERMEAGVTFPPVIIGKWPHSAKYGSSGVVDGIHRLGAAEVAKVDMLDAEEKVFLSLDEALSYMYEANMAHGLPVTEGQRNARIKLLHKINPKMTLEKLATQFKLGKSSVARILSNEQGEGKSGPKSGTHANQAHKDQKPYKPAAFFNNLVKVNMSCSSAALFAELVAFASPETESGVKIDKEKVKVLKEAKKNLEALLHELS